MSTEEEIQLLVVKDKIDQILQAAIKRPLVREEQLKLIDLLAERTRLENRLEFYRIENEPRPVIGYEITPPEEQISGPVQRRREKSEDDNEQTIVPD